MKQNVFIYFLLYSIVTKAHASLCRYQRIIILYIFINYRFRFCDMHRSFVYWMYNVDGGVSGFQLAYIFIPWNCNISFYISCNNVCNIVALSMPSPPVCNVSLAYILIRSICQWVTDLHEQNFNVSLCFSHSLPEQSLQ